MIIVSQEKNAILNFDNTTTIKTEKHLEKCEIVARVNNGHFATLGEYATEERAKEVLINIGQCYCNTKSYEFVSNMPDYLGNKLDYLNKLSEKAVVYQMPKE